jgi:hypothetical protein
MAWTTPKTDFSSADGLTAAQMNEIGANLAALKLLVDAALGDVVLADMTNGQYIGDTITGAMAVSCTVYDFVYSTSSGYNKAKGDSDATIPAVGIALETGTGNKLILVKGLIKNTSWSLTKGSPIWLSPGTAGAFTQTKPTTTGNRIQYLGYAAETNIIAVDICAVWGEVA